MKPNKKVILLGANSLMAPWLVSKLAAAGYRGYLCSRSPLATSPPENFEWLKIDPNGPQDVINASDATLISLLPIWLLPSLLLRYSGVKQLVVFSSTSRFSKLSSFDKEDRRLAHRIASAEEEIRAYCAEKIIPWTILRPTLTYDGQHDHNVTAIARFIKRWKFFPIASPAEGHRQPVHAEDLAGATIACLENSKAFNRAYNLGGETLSYYEMVKRIFTALDIPPRLLPLPETFIRAFTPICPLNKKLSNRIALLIRMNQNLAYDYSAAQNDLGYSPRAFQPYLREE